MDRQQYEYTGEVPDTDSRRSRYPPYNRTIEWSDGSTTEVFTRERPQLIFSGDQWSRRGSTRIPVALTNGVTPGNATMPGRTSGFTGDWSYTHVQLIDLGLS